MEEFSSRSRGRCGLDGYLGLSSRAMAYSCSSRRTSECQVKQVLQSLRNGKTEVGDVPCPMVGAGEVLVRTSRSLISSGTERTMVEFGKAGWIEKASQQPDKVRMVLDKIKTDGLVSTIEAVRNKLDQPLLMGYCNVGTVMEVGAETTGFQ